MGTWLGALGGLGMLALIAALLVRFLRDMGAAIPAEAPRAMAAAAAVMIAEMMVAGLIRHMQVEPVSLLDIRTVWQRLTLWPGIAWPFPAYAALASGAWIAWNVRRLLGKRWAALFLACPGAVLLFLPCAWAWAAFGVALVLRLALRGREQEVPQPTYPAYIALLSVLALLSGLFLILFTGGGAA